MQVYLLMRDCADEKGDSRLTLKLNSESLDTLTSIYLQKRFGWRDWRALLVERLRESYTVGDNEVLACLYYSTLTRTLKTYSTLLYTAG